MTVRAKQARGTILTLQGLAGETCKGQSVPLHRPQGTTPKHCGDRCCLFS